jgi:hypothetical protein
VLFAKAAVLDILTVPGIVCRTYMDDYPKKVCIMQTNNQAFIMDVDIPEDILTYNLSLSEVLKSQQ